MFPVYFVDGGNLVQHALSVAVPRALQIGILQVIHGVQAVEVIFRRRGGASIRLDRLLPQSLSGEDVRGHMQSMRSRGCDAGVTARRGQPLCSNGWKIVAMDQVMRYAGMIRLLGEYLFQDFRSLQLVGIALVGRKGSNIERQRIEYGRFSIFGIALG